MLSFKSFISEDGISESDIQLLYYAYLNEDFDVLSESVYDPVAGDSEDVLIKKSSRRRLRDIARSRLDSVYGKSKDSDHPITGQDRIDSVISHIRDHYSKPSEDQATAGSAAEQRLAKAYGVHVKDLKSRLYTTNKKLATSAQGDVLDKNGRSLTTTLGATGAPFKYKHQHGDEESSVTTCDRATRACAGKEGERNGTCLAMGGTYRFNRNTVKQDIDSQIQHDSREDESGNSPHRDYHLLATHYAVQEAKKAKSKNKAVALRTNVTDESKDALNHAIHKIKTGEIETDADTKHAMHHHLHLYNYGKNHKTSLHDPEYNVTTIASDTGPVVSNGGKFNLGNVNREKSLNRITTSKSGDARNQYVIVGGRSKTDVDENGAGRLFKRPRKSNSQAQKDWHDSTLKNIRTVRRYDLDSHPHIDGESETHHSEKGHGYITVNRGGQKRRVYYQDYHVPLNGSEHDARFDPREKGNTEDRHGNKVGAAIVSTPTASTSNAGTEFGQMFHDVNNIKHEAEDEHGRTGVLEVNHPELIHKSKGR